MTVDLKKSDKKLVAVCGLFCPSCAIYIASNEDNGRLVKQAKMLNFTPEETRCKGCRSDKRNKNCDNCYMLKCSTEKGIDFCSDCIEYPCDELRNFQAILPHRLELWKDLNRIKEVGFEIHFQEAIENYKCQKCDTINTGWDINCRKCGYEPSCKYVENNETEIRKRINAST